MRLQPTPAPRRSAFTIVEVLVAIAMLSFLIILLSSLVDGVSRAWTSGDRQAETFQNGRAILDLISRDLSQAVISPRLQFIQDPGSLNNLLTNSTIQVANSDAIFFQTVSSGDPLSNIAEVGYYLTDRSDSSGNHYFELKRFFVPPTDPTKLPGQVQPNPAFHINDSPSPVIYNTAATSIMPSWINLNGTTFSGSTQKDFEYFSNTVSSGVVALWLRPLDGNGDPIAWLSSADGQTNPIKFNSTAHFQPSNPASTTTTATSLKYTSPTTTAQANLLPSAVEITVITLDSRAFARKPVIPPMPAAFGPDDIPGNISAMNASFFTQKVTSARTFSTTVALRNAQP